MDSHECLNESTFADMGANGEAIHTFEISGLPDNSNAEARILSIVVENLVGPPTSYEIQIWNQANADHFANLDNDLDATVFKEAGVNPSTPCRRDSSDFGDLPFRNKDTSGLKNRMYVGIKLTGGGATTDMRVKIELATRER